MSKFIHNYLYSPNFSLKTADISPKVALDVAHVDRAATAKKFGFELLPTQSLIFGNPAVGTKLKRSRRSIGLVLPIKVLAWEEADGTGWVDYTDPGYLSAFTGLSTEDRFVTRCAGCGYRGRQELTKLPLCAWVKSQRGVSEHCDRHPSPSLLSPVGERRVLFQFPH